MFGDELLADLMLSDGQSSSRVLEWIVICPDLSGWTELQKDERTIKNCGET